MPTISIGDAELYYEDTGRGQPLLLVPGLSGRGSFWANQVADFSRDFRVVVHDHRGTARSTHSRIRYSVEQMADDLLRLMDALGIEAAHLVGYSTGGAIGQVIALEHSRRLHSLVLSATWAGPDPYFLRLFESRKGVLLSQGVEAYVRASALFMSPPAWISANDALLTEQHAAALAEAAPVEVTASRIDAIMRHDRRAAGRHPGANAGDRRPGRHHHAALLLRGAGQPRAWRQAGRARDRRSRGPCHLRRPLQHGRRRLPPGAARPLIVL